MTENTDLQNMQLQLSPTPKPPEKMNKKVQKSALPTDEKSKDKLYEALMSNPVTKKMVINMINENKEKIAEFKKNQKLTEAGSSTTDSPKVATPTSLVKGSAYQKLQQQKLRLEEKARKELDQISASPIRKQPRKTLLKGVHAFIDVMYQGESKFESVKSILLSFGATVASTLSKSVTLVIYKDGTYETYKTARSWKIPMVSILWLDAVCKSGVKVKARYYPALGTQSTTQASDDVCKNLLNRRRSKSVPASTSRKNFNDHQKMMANTMTVDDEALMNLSDVVLDSQNENEVSHVGMITKRRNTGRCLSSFEGFNRLDSSSSLTEINDNNSNCTPISTRGSTEVEAFVNNIANKENNNTPRNQVLPGITKSLSKARKTISFAIDENNEISKSLTTADESARKSRISTRKSLIPDKGSIIDVIVANFTPERLQSSTPNVSVQSATRKNLRKTLHVTGDAGILQANAISNIGNPAIEPANSKRRETTPKVLHVTGEDDNCLYQNTTLNLTGTPVNKKTPTRMVTSALRRRTNINPVAMEITELSEENDAENDATVHFDEAMDFTKPVNKTPAASLPTTAVSRKSTRSSTSSGRTSTSDNLATFNPRRSTRRLTMHATIVPPNKKDISMEMSYLRLSTSGELTETENQNQKTKLSSECDLQLQVSKSSDSHMSSLVLSEESSRDSDAASLSSIASHSSSSSSNMSERVKITPIKRKSPSVHDETSAKKSSPRISTVQPIPEITPNRRITRRLSVALSAAKTASSIYSMHSSQVNSDASSCTTSSNNITSDATSTQSSSISKDIHNASTVNDSESSDSSSSEVIPSTPLTQNKTKRRLCNPDDINISLALEAEEENEKERQQRYLEAQNNSVTKNLEALKIKSPVQTVTTPRILLTPNVKPQGRQTDDFVPDTPTNKMPTQSRLQVTQQNTQATQQATQKKLKQKWIVCTQFHRLQVVEFNGIVNKLGGFNIERDVTSKTTHLVAMQPLRSLNMLRALSRGIWILRSEWLFDSLKAGKWLEEEDYEAIEFTPRVRHHRVQKECFGKAFVHDVFVDCGPIYVANSCHPSKKDLIELIKLCKGTVVTDIADAKIIIGNPEENPFPSQICLEEVWVLDSITIGYCVKFKKYNLQCI